MLTMNFIVYVCPWSILFFFSNLMVWMILLFIDNSFSTSSSKIAFAKRIEQTERLVLTLPFFWPFSYCNTSTIDNGLLASFILMNSWLDHVFFIKKRLEFVKNILIICFRNSPVSYPLKDLRIVFSFHVWFWFIVDTFFFLLNKILRALEQFFD